MTIDGAIKRKDYTLCYDGRYTGIDTLINTEGYFCVGKISYPNGDDVEYKNDLDTFFLNFMLWTDGTFLYNFYGTESDIPKYFEEIAENESRPGKDPFYKWLKWGCYKLFDDTIKAQFISKPRDLTNYWGVGNLTLKIIDQNTLQFIPSEYEDKNNYIPFTRILPAKFIAAKNKPHSNCWFKTRKWFWCDKEKYKEYMAKLKEKKKKARK